MSGIPAWLQVVVDGPPPQDPGLTPFVPAAAFILLAAVVWWIWRRLADGCHPDRDIEAALRDQFADLTVERFRTGLPVVSPHIMGTAVV